MYIFLLCKLCLYSYKFLFWGTLRYELVIFITCFDTYFKIIFYLYSRI